MDAVDKLALIQDQIDAAAEDGFGNKGLDEWQHKNEVALRLSLGQDNPTYQKLVNVRFTPGATIHGPGIDNSRVYAQARHSGIQSSVALLKAARGEVELMVGSKSDTSAPDTLTTAPGGTRVFIVHGHDDARKLQVATLVRDLTGVKATILSEYPGRLDLDVSVINEQRA